MLAAHRDQENLEHSHQAASKQVPKTPGARYPKTPVGFRNDENARTAFAGKTAVGGGATKPGGIDRLTVKGTGQRQAMVTPMGEARSRAPLGNKTTNAKARPGQSAGVKDIVKEIEKTQAKLTIVQKPKPKPVDLAPIKFAIKPDKGEPSDDEDEPEYAPPQPAPLPYESDVLPAGGLTFEGLKKENFLKGFYEHFHNPVDENGVSREEKKFDEEMQAVLKKADERNERDTAELGWNIDDVAETATAIRRKPESHRATEPAPGKTLKRVTAKNPPTISSRRAASALAIQSDNQKATAIKPTLINKPARRPLAALIPGNRLANPATMAPATSASNSAGEAASRTTIGYNKGRTASSMIHPREGSVGNRPNQPINTVGSRDANPELTLTPARIRQGVLGRDSPHEQLQLPRPQFLSIFDDVDGEDLSPMRGPYLDSDDAEEEFELKLTI
ncbi:Uncharacterized protein TCAP_07573 [Tolypocladium capitatum]|uniref:Uncharacterized protein n=1 Tax=Tolypocladium capitatum TaxID=45235 RepID=A0A2K3PSR1_9HYPO|nr:Uncharacterized protein TCAP_07573 [Tolypocladium capitatum]